MTADKTGVERNSAFSEGEVRQRVQCRRHSNPSGHCIWRGTEKGETRPYMIDDVALEISVEELRRSVTAYLQMVGG